MALRAVVVYALAATTFVRALPLLPNSVSLSAVRHQAKHTEYTRGLRGPNETINGNRGPNQTINEIIQGATQIDEAIDDVANSTGTGLLANLNTSILGKAFPKLKRIGSYAITAAESELNVEEAQQQSMQTLTKKQSAYEADLNHKAMVAAAEDFGRSKAQNAMAQAMGPAMNESITAEQKSEEFRVEAARFAHVAAVAAEEAEGVSQAAKVIAKKLPKTEATKALVWIREVEEEARAMQDEGDQSERLAKMAEDVMQEAGKVADGALVRARAAFSKANKSLESAQATAARLTKLRERAFKAEMQTSAAAADTLD